jgi:phage terminase large subunit-like protein
MEQINLPPFYPGQKIVALKTSKCKKIQNGQTYTAAFCVKGCCQGWDVGIKEMPANEDHSQCFKCRKVVLHTGKFFLIGMASAFVPLEETFQPVSLTKVIEEETKLVCVN